MKEIILDEDFSIVKQANKDKVIGWTIFSAVLVAIFALFVVVMCSINPKGNNSLGLADYSYINYTNYNRVQDNMTYQQVVEIFEGNDGVLSSSSGSGPYTLKYYEWSNYNKTKIITIGFLNNKVCAKAQVGL